MKTISSFLIAVALIFCVMLSHAQWITSGFSINRFAQTTNNGNHNIKAVRIGNMKILVYQELFNLVPIVLLRLMKQKCLNPWILLKS